MAELWVEDIIRILSNRDLRNMSENSTLGIQPLALCYTNDTNGDRVSKKTLKFISDRRGSDQAALPGTEQHQQKVDNADRDWKTALNRLTIQFDERILLSSSKPRLHKIPDTLLTQKKMIHNHR